MTTHVVPGEFPLHMPVDTLEEQLTNPPTSGRCAPLPTHNPAWIPMRLNSTHHWYVQADVHMGDKRTTPKATFTRTRLLEDSLIFTHVPKQ